MTTENAVTWTVTEQEADFIMKLIMTQPYGQVAGLVQRLLMQANTQPPSDRVEMAE